MGQWGVWGGGVCGGPGGLDVRTEGTSLTKEPVQEAAGQSLNSLAEGQRTWQKPTRCLCCLVLLL